MTSDEFFYVWLFYGSGKTHNWCYGWSTEAEGKLSISRPFMECPEKLARLACGSRLSRSLAHCLARGFSKQGLKCPCADCKYRSSRRVCARKRNLTTVYDITKIYLDRRKEALARYLWLIFYAIKAFSFQSFLKHFLVGNYSQTRSSVPVTSKLMNSLMKKWFRLLIQ